MRLARGFGGFWLRFRARCWPASERVHCQAPELGRERALQLGRAGASSGARARAPGCRRSGARASGCDASQNRSHVGRPEEESKESTANRSAPAGWAKTHAKKRPPANAVYLRKFHATHFLRCFEMCHAERFMAVFGAPRDMRIAARDAPSRADLS